MALNKIVCKCITGMSHISVLFSVCVCVCVYVVCMHIVCVCVCVREFMTAISYFILYVKFLT